MAVPEYAPDRRRGVRRLLPLALLVLAGCASLPSGPSVMALPGTNKSFDQFRSDETTCRNFASQAIGATSASNAAVDAGVRSAAVGTLVGAAAGAAIDGSQGAGVGAGMGLVVGSLAGASAADASWYGAQKRYDQSYVQCMYARGHRVPVAGSYVVRRTTSSNSSTVPANATAPLTPVVPAAGYVPPPGSPPPIPDDIPPPPAGTPPPPPPR
jgi:outer membrane lipoprotein SlyB